MTIGEEHNRYNNKLFRKLAPFYDALASAVWRLRIKVAKKVKNTKKHEVPKILDVACGTGSQTLAFAKRGFETVGVDLSPDMLNYAKQKAKRKKLKNVKFICCDATKLPFKKNTFDVSSVSMALHDMPDLIRINVLKEMMRVTKEKGRILIVEYNKPKNRVWAWFMQQYQGVYETKYYRRFMKQGLEFYLNKAGLNTYKKETYYLQNIQVVECMNTKKKKTIPKQNNPTQPRETSKVLNSTKNKKRHTQKRVA